MQRQIAGKCKQMTGVRYACRKFLHVRDITFLKINFAAVQLFQSIPIH